MFGHECQARGSEKKLAESCSVSTSLIWVLQEFSWNTSGVVKIVHQWAIEGGLFIERLVGQQTLYSTSIHALQGWLEPKQQRCMCVLKGAASDSCDVASSNIFVSLVQRRLMYRQNRQNYHIFGDKRLHQAVQSAYDYFYCDHYKKPIC